MYLLDTHVISEARKGVRADPGVNVFWAEVALHDTPLFLASVTVGELCRGVERIRHRGDQPQAARLEQWLAQVLLDYGDRILPFDAEAAQVWGCLRVRDPHHVIDQQIASIALLHDLTVVTRNTSDFLNTGVRLLNPFQGTGAGSPRRDPRRADSGS